MSIADTEQRARLAAEVRAEARRIDLRAKLGMYAASKATVSLDLGAQRPRVLARIIAIVGDHVEIVELGDARIFPKPTRTIGIDLLVGVEAT